MITGQYCHQNCHFIVGSDNSNSCLWWIGCLCPGFSDRCTNSLFENWFKSGSNRYWLVLFEYFISQRLHQIDRCAVNWVPTGRKVADSFLGCKHLYICDWFRKANLELVYICHCQKPLGVKAGLHYCTESCSTSHLHAEHQLSTFYSPAFSAFHFAGNLWKQKTIVNESQM